MMQYDGTSTICAISTPPGRGGIAVIRVSGRDTYKVLKAVVTIGHDWEDIAGYSVVFGKIYHGDALLDEVLLSCFRNPKSYTGEDSVEISCHGSTYIQQSIIHLLLQHGATLASPGEFTQRAFLSGKLDLTQAEAVMDLIHAEHSAAHDVAIQQMKGGLSSVLQTVREEGIQFAALLELELDFGEEDVEFADRSGFLKRLDLLEKEIGELLDSFTWGTAIKKGIPIAIVGIPNAGKSTLLNAILREEKAIVSPIAGTTRDVVEDLWHMHGIQYRFVDTAGIRETEDTIEKIGIERAELAIDKAQILLIVFDPTQETPEDFSLFWKEKCKDTPSILVVSKTDLLNADELTSCLDSLEAMRWPGCRAIIASSEEHGEALTSLEQSLEEWYGSAKPTGSIIVSNARHAQELRLCLEELHAIRAGFSVSLPTDLIAQHVRGLLRHLGNITGDIDVDKNILGTIFSAFCIGK